MNAVWVSLFLVLILVGYEQRRERLNTARRIVLSKKRKGNGRMLELAKRFIGKECVIYTLNSQLEGTIEAVEGGALLLEKDGSHEAVNLDFVLRIREYPRKKNGKKKSIVVD